MSNKYTYEPPCSEKVLRSMYVDDCMTQVEIADALGTTQKVIWNAMRHYGITTRRQVKRDQRGPKNDSWRGGRVSYNGYVYVTDPNHPHAVKSGYVAEHIKVALDHAGRYRLSPGEHVHHIDLDRTNNDPTNLVIGNTKQHGDWHASLQREAAKLVRRGLMTFNEEEGYTLLL